MRILADLPADDIKWLDSQAAERGVSRAALIRDAIAAFRAGEQDWLEHGFGLWTRYGQGVEGKAFEAKIRAQWDRRA